MHDTDLVGRALNEAAARVRAIRDLAGSEFGRSLPTAEVLAGVRGLAAYAAIWLALAQEQGEAA